MYSGKQVKPDAHSCVTDLSMQNGWIGQFSVQAIDFNILIISISVLITVRKNSFEFQPTWAKTLAVCAIPWILPLITSKPRPPTRYAGSFLI